MQVATGIQDSVTAANLTATAPAANTTICTIAASALPAGKYTVSACIFESGTVDTNTLNGQIRAGANVLATIPTNGSSTQRTTLARVTLDGATALTLNVGVSAGGAGAVYNGSIVVERTA